MNNFLTIILSLLVSFIVYNSYVQKKHASEYYTLMSNYINNKIPIVTQNIYDAVSHEKEQISEYYTIVSNYINNVVYPEEDTAIYTKEKLGSITSIKQDEIIKNTVDKIRKNVVSAANNGDSIYYWSDRNYILDKSMFDKVVDKLKVIFPEINITYKYSLDRSITVDWR